MTEVALKVWTEPPPRSTTTTGQQENAGQQNPGRQTTTTPTIRATEPPPTAVQAIVNTSVTASPAIVSTTHPILNTKRPDVVKPDASNAGHNQIKREKQSNGPCGRRRIKFYLSSNLPRARAV